MASPTFGAKKFPSLMPSVNTDFTEHPFPYRYWFPFNVILCHLNKRSLRRWWNRETACCPFQSQYDGEQRCAFEQLLLPVSSSTHDEPAKHWWHHDCIAVCRDKHWPKDDRMATVQTSNAELMQALVSSALYQPRIQPVSAYSDRMILGKMQTDVILWEWKTVQQTIDAFF